MKAENLSMRKMHQQAERERKSTQAQPPSASVQPMLDRRQSGHITPTAGNLLYLQRNVGNRQVQQLLRPQFRWQPHFAAPRVQRVTLQSPRFSDNPRLDDTANGKTTIKVGDKGLHVSILQQALIDAGYSLPKSGVSGTFEAETEAAVILFQRSKKGLKDDGVVTSDTLNALDAAFHDRGGLAKIPQKQVPPAPPKEGVEWDPAAVPAELLAGTRPLSADEKAEVERRRTTEVQAPKGGVLPTFQMKIATHPESYESRVENATNDEIDWQYATIAKGKAAARKDPAKLYQWDIIEKVASLSKREADRVVGNYATGKAFKANINLMDAWEEKEKQFAGGGKTYEQKSVEWRVEKILGGPTVRAIDKQHGAVQSRAAEQKILTDIRDRIIAKRRAELIEIHKGWPGFADAGKVFLQRFVQSDAAKNRDAMWKLFQTTVHEYIHTLEHSKHVTYRKSLGELKGGKTYREGMTDYFTKIVLESVAYDDALRKEVEGPYHDPAAKHPIPPYSGYAEAKNAEAVVGVVGLRNAMAAFFTGKIELIGG